jgi:hypothetical protein
VGGGGRGTSRLLFETIILNAFNPPPPPLAILTYRVPVLQDIVLCVCVNVHFRFFFRVNLVRAGMSLYEAAPSSRSYLSYRYIGT